MIFSIVWLFGFKLVSILKPVVSNQSNEYNTELSLNWMDFNFRQYDPQIGRFLGVDPLADFGGQDRYSPYAAMGNMPESMIDPDGLILGMPKRPGEGVVVELASAWSSADFPVATYAGSSMSGGGGNPLSPSLWGGGSMFGSDFSYMGMSGAMLESYYRNNASERAIINGQYYGSGRMIANYHQAKADKEELLAKGEVLPEVEVRGTRNNQVWGWRDWRDKMARRYGVNNPLDVSAFNGFIRSQEMRNPYARAAAYGYMPFNPEAVMITVPLSLIGVTGFSGSLNIGVVGDEFGFFINGGYNIGLPDVGVGVGMTLGEYRGVGSATFDSYMGYGESWGGGFGLFGGYSKGYANYGDNDHVWNSYYGGVGAASPSLNWSPMNFSKGWSFKFR